MVGGIEKTRVYNARATNANGNGEINIMVIQVGLTNFDETGHVITVPPPVMTVPDQIAHRVTWSPETGVIVKKEEPLESVESEQALRKLEPETFTNNSEKVVLPEYVSHYLSRQTTVPDPDVESRNFLATVIALAVGLTFLALLAYGISVLLHKRKKKILERQRELEIITMKKMRNRPPERRPDEGIFSLDFDDLSYHDYENMSEVDESSDFEFRRPPPVPPRVRRPRPPLYMVLDQPVSILVERERYPSRFSKKSHIEREVERQLLQNHIAEKDFHKSRRGSF